MSTTGLPGGGSGGSRGGDSLYAIVRALGSLLTALGTAPQPPANADLEDDPAEVTSELMFEDARRQAYATIDDAVDRARAAWSEPDAKAVTERLARLERRVDAIAAQLNLPPGNAQPAATRASRPSAPAPVPEAAVNGAPGDAFEPGLGSLLIAVGPISGFQGLMRVQAAIASVDAVDDVAIEGYARSEATVRTLLGGTLEPERVAEALSRELGQPASVRETSAAERRLRIALGE